MKYKVIKNFFDLEDKNHYYEEGDEYPRKGVEATKERIKELSSKNNKRNEPLITKAE